MSFLLKLESEHLIHQLFVCDSFSFHAHTLEVSCYIVLVWPTFAVPIPLPCIHRLIRSTANRAIELPLNLGVNDFVVFAVYTSFDRDLSKALISRIFDRMKCFLYERSRFLTYLS